MLNVTVQLVNVENAQAALTKLGQKLYMQKTALDAIGGDLEAYFAGPAYASQGGVFGNKWESLSSPYSRLKLKHYAGRGLLIKTGEMQKDYYHKATENSLEVGNTAPQFKYHQSTEPRKRLPRRATIGVNDAVMDIISARIQKDVEDKLKSVGLS